MAWQHCSDSTTQQILQETTAEFTAKATSIDEQLPPLYAEQEKLADQISVVEECIEDYVASKLKAILYGLAHNYTTSAKQTAGEIPKYDRFSGEWTVGEIYPYNPAQSFINFVSEKTIS
jgi:hypothetical protein